MTTRRLITLTLFAMTILGCVRDIDLENQTAVITSIGALSLDDQSNVVVPYTLRDLEGDDQVVSVEVCDAVDDNCGVAAVAIGSTPLDRVPTVPKNTDVLHEFVWQPWCGRWLEEELVGMELDDEFVIRVSVLPSDDDPVYSEPSSLEALAADSGTCE